MDKIRILLPSGYRFECRECGKCCHRWNFKVDPDTFSKLRKTSFWTEMKAKFPGHEIIHFNSENDSAFMEKVDGACILFEKKLCAIHKELGYSAKPLGCRRFPFFFTETPEGIYVGLSYTCPSVRDKTGVPIEEYILPLQELAAQDLFRHIAGSTVAIAENMATDFAGYKTIEAFILKAIEDTNVTSAFVRVLTSLALLVTGRKDASDSVSCSEILYFLNHPHSQSFTADPYFAGYQVQTAASMIALLESRDIEESRVNAGIILKGGNLHSETFGRIISVRQLSEYMRTTISPSGNLLLTDYIRHLLWWKYPLTTETVMTGLSLLSLLPVMFAWYAGVSEAEAEAEAEAGAEDETDETFVSDAACKVALGWIDTHIHHGNFLEKYIKKYADDFLRQVETFMEEGMM